jgi:hypothetical protein
MKSYREFPQTYHILKRTLIRHLLIGIIGAASFGLCSMPFLMLPALFVVESEKPWMPLFVAFIVGTVMSYVVHVIWLLVQMPQEVILGEDKLVVRNYAGKINEIERHTIKEIEHHRNKIVFVGEKQKLTFRGQFLEKIDQVKLNNAFPFWLPEKLLSVPERLYIERFDELRQEDLASPLEKNTLFRTKKYKIWLGIIIFFGAILLLLASYFVIFEKNNIWIGGLILLIGFIGLGIGCWRSLNHWALFNEEGIQFQQGRQTHKIRWEEIEAAYFGTEKAVFWLENQQINFSYHTPDKIKLNSFLSHMAKQLHLRMIPIDSGP